MYIHLDALVHYSDHDLALLQKHYNNNQHQYTVLLAHQLNGDS